MLPYAKECNQEIQNILEHGISAFSFPHFRVETNANSKVGKRKCGDAMLQNGLCKKQVKFLQVTAAGHREGQGLIGCTKDFCRVLLSTE